MRTSVVFLALAVIGLALCCVSVSAQVRGFDYSAENCAGPATPVTLETGCSPIDTNSYKVACTATGMEVNFYTGSRTCEGTVTSTQAKPLRVCTNDNDGTGGSSRIESCSAASALASSALLVAALAALNFLKF